LPLSQFKYKEIREFSSQVIRIVEKELQNRVKHIVMTLHGINTGLDESESFLAQLAGINDAIKKIHDGNFIEKITIIDKDPLRVQRLRVILHKNLALAFGSTYAQKLTPDGSLYRIALDQGVVQADDVFASNINSKVVIRDPPRIPESISSAGIESIRKHTAFVAMALGKNEEDKAGKEDVFYLGIQPSVKNNNYLCEFIKDEAYIGDIVEHVLKKIDDADLVVADLSGNKPNVYLEVGYAWGQKRPTIFIAKEGEKLEFDIRNQKVLRYSGIRRLEASLTDEIKELKSKGILARF
jgi:hypothetical protein